MSIGQGADISAQERIRDLEGTVIDMHSLAREALFRISTTMHGALSTLETTRAYRYPEIIAGMLETALSVAQDYQACIDGQAEAAGVDITDAAAERRLSARMAADTVG